eukprot:TRINITY_DN27679_c0_g1_i1.p1 TRINITY_DN27679_c0_g1~~TRINITY_DN27679_c0_g1_i1.p1  ORF type:complete len:998 (+),score=148.04 TRINITY_DN27679_c0_g1_i1:95-3088(+)
MDEANEEPPQAKRRSSLRRSATQPLFPLHAKLSAETTVGCGAQNDARRDTYEPRSLPSLFSRDVSGGNREALKGGDMMQSETAFMLQLRRLVEEHEREVQMLKRENRNLLAKALNPVSKRRKSVAMTPSGGDESSPMANGVATPKSIGGAERHDDGTCSSPLWNGARGSPTAESSTAPRSPEKGSLQLAAINLETGSLTGFPQANGLSRANGCSEKSKLDDAVTGSESLPSFVDRSKFRPRQRRRCKSGGESSIGSLPEGEGSDNLMTRTTSGDEGNVKRVRSAKDTATAASLSFINKAQQVYQEKVDKDKKETTEPRSESKASGRPPGPLTDPWSVGHLWSEWMEEGPTEEVPNRISLALMSAEENRTRWPVEAQKVHLSIGRRLLLLCMDPSRKARVAWDALGLIVLMYDMLTIPLQAFQPEPHMITTSGDWCTLVYWSLDMLGNFFLGFYDAQGVLVLGPAQIARRYLRSTFLFDLCVVGCDWISALMDYLGSKADGADSLGMMRATRSVRVVRVARTLRLARLAKLRSLMYTVQERISSEAVSILLGTFRNCVLLLLLNHVCACTWFFVGSTELPGDSWIRRADILDKGMQEQYVVAIHWTLCQFTPAPTAVGPVTLRETIFNVWLIIIAMVAFSTFLGGITASMTKLRALQDNEITQQFMLRKYLSQNNVSRSLSARIFRYTEIARERHKQKMDRSKVFLLKYLSGPLNVELQTELFEPPLMVHPFFVECKHCSAATMRDICFTALGKLHLSRGDFLFNFGSTSHSMYIIQTGTLLYERPRRSKMKSIRRFVTLREAQWCCETVLWAPWIHHGTMSAMIECEVIRLDSAKFRSVCIAHLGVFKYAQAYAMEYLENLIAITEHGNWNWDVPSELMLKTKCEGDQSTASAAISREVEYAETVEAQLLVSSLSESGESSEGSYETDSEEAWRRQEIEKETEHLCNGSPVEDIKNIKDKEDQTRSPCDSPQSSTEVPAADPRSEDPQRAGTRDFPL